MNRTKKILLNTLSSLAVVGVIGGALALGSQGQLAASFAGPGQTRVGGAPWSESYQYTGAVQYVNVPPDTDSMTVVATGGDGGGDSVWPDDEVEGSGAVVTGTIAVTPGQRVAISVGGVGQEGESGSSDPRGGWGGLGLTGGNGNGASDHLRTSGAGGGATTIQLANNDGSNEQTLIVAAGGGGNGAASGDSGAVGNGGDGGHAWGGQKGEGGSDLWGGSGGSRPPTPAVPDCAARVARASAATAAVVAAAWPVAPAAAGRRAPRPVVAAGRAPRSPAPQMTTTSIAERYASTRSRLRPTAPSRSPGPTSDHRPRHPGTSAAQPGWCVGRHTSWTPCELHGR